MSFPPNGPGRPQDGKGFVVGPDDGDPYWWLGSTTLVKVTGEASSGAVDIVDHRVPAGYTPPTHVHSGQDEIFVVLDGTLDVHCGEDRWTTTVGSLVFLPRGVPHGFTVTGNAPARTLLINAPAGFAEVIVELGEQATDLDLPGPDVAVPDPARVTEVSEAHGIHSA